MTEQQIVATAAAWLDVRHPGWHEKIDLDSFHITHYEYCVGGQIGVHWGTLTNGLVEDHPGRQGAYLRQAFAMGQSFWEAEITARQLQTELVAKLEDPTGGETGEKWQTHQGLNDRSSSPVATAAGS